MKRSIIILVVAFVLVTTVFGVQSSTVFTFYTPAFIASETEIDHSHVPSANIPAEANTLQPDMFVSATKNDLPEKEEYIHAVCRMEDTLLRNIPVWKLINKGDMASAQLTHDVLLKYMEEHSNV